MSYMEEHCYHPIISDLIKTLRRENRNDICVARFIKYAISRKKRLILDCWMEEGAKDFVCFCATYTNAYRLSSQTVRKIKRTREIIVSSSLKWRNNYCGRAFDR
jgi:hypothetical protein